MYLLSVPQLLAWLRGQEEAAFARGHSTHDIRPTCRSPRNRSGKGPKDKSIYKPTSLNQVVVPVTNTCLNLWACFAKYQSGLFPLIHSNIFPFYYILIWEVTAPLGCDSGQWVQCGHRQEKEGSDDWGLACSPFLCWAPTLLSVLGTRRKMTVIPLHPKSRMPVFWEAHFPQAVEGQLVAWVIGSHD